MDYWWSDSEKRNNEAFLSPMMTRCSIDWGWVVCWQSRLLCGCNNYRQCNIFIGCKPQDRISHTVPKPITLYKSLAEPVEHLPQYLEVVGLSSTWDRIFSHACAHFGICGRCGIILSRCWLRRQHQYRTALVLTQVSESSWSDFFPCLMQVSQVDQGHLWERKLCLTR